MMRRLATLFVVLAAGPALAQAPMLRTEALVRGEIVVIGDLVEHAGLAADVPVFRAPDLGQTGAVSARAVAEAVRPHGVVLDARGPAEVLVTRESRIVPAAEFEAAVAAALAAQLGIARAADIKVSFDRTVEPAHVEPLVAARPRVTRLAYDARTTRFDASFEIPGSAAARRLALRMTGEATETVETIVAMRPVGRGDMIRNADIAIERRPRAEIGADGYFAADSVVGMAARRQLRAGQIVRQSDLMKPEIIQRNDTVTLVFAVPGITVATRGRALAAGIEGDTVTVVNLQSKRIVQGTVTGPGEVTVSPGAQTGQMASADPVSTGAVRPNPVRTETIRPASGSAVR